MKISTVIYGRCSLAFQKYYDLTRLVVHYKVLTVMPIHTSQEYQKAASRHLYTCNNLCTFIKKTTNATPEQKKQLLQNMYYLSGYIIECIGSHALLVLIPKKGNSILGVKSIIHNPSNNIIPTLDDDCFGNTLVKNAMNSSINSNREEKSIDSMYASWGIAYNHQYVDNTTLDQLDNLYKKWNTCYRYNDMYCLNNNASLWCENLFPKDSKLNDQRQNIIWNIIQQQSIISFFEFSKKIHDEVIKATRGK